MLKIRSNEGFRSLEPFPEIELPDFVVVTGLNATGKTHLLWGIKDGAIETIPATEESARAYVTTLNPWIEHELLTRNYNGRLRNLGEDAARIWAERRHGDSDILQRIADALEIEDPGSLRYDHIKGHALPHIFSNKSHGGRPFMLELASTIRVKQLEAEYHRRNRYLKHDGQRPLSRVLDDDEYREKYGAPVEASFNKAIAPLGYELVGEGLAPQDVDCDLRLRLLHREAGHEVEFGGLSSGESAVLSLLVHQFVHGGSTIGTPPAARIMLLDEVDSALHPKLMRAFVRDLQATLVDRGTSVILATHSPSMVALAPDESLFAMKPGEVPRLQKVTKDHALGLLTSGVPSLRVDHEHRRQVFVEASFDAEIYDGVYELLRDQLEPEIALSFITAGRKRINPANRAEQGDEGGGCAMVRNLVKQLRKTGNDRVFGIVDHDGRAESTDGIQVVGGGNAYAIENVLLDPLLVGALGIREEAFSRSDLGDTKFSSLGNLDREALQGIADFVSDALCPDDERADRVEIDYVRADLVILCPRWLRETSGHGLAQRILDKFPRLRELRPREPSDLAKFVIRRVLREHPELIPSTLLVLMRNIQNEGAQ